jgi:hypothetical protein
LWDNEEKIAVTGNGGYERKEMVKTGLQVGGG